MTDLILTNVKDAWVNSARTGQNYGSANRVQLQSGARFGFLRPNLGNISGRTVVDAYLVGRSAGTAAQTLTVTPVTERWAPGQVTWSNKPAVNAGAAVAAAIPAAADGVAVEVTGLAAIIQAVADGTDWFGLRVTTSSGTNQSFYSNDSGEPAWELHVTLSDAPEQPSNLRPDGGGAVGGPTPILAWDFLDLGGDSTEQASSRVQVDSTVGAPDGVTPDYDSGWQINADPQWSLVARHSVVGVGPHYWRVQVRDGDSNTSEWSDWAEFTVDDLPVLVIDSPTGPFGDPSPTLLAHLTGGTVKSWKAIVTSPDRSDVRIESGVQTGAIDWDIPERNEAGRRVFREDQQGWIHLRVWDTVDRAVAVGQTTYVEQWIQAVWDDDLGVSAPSSLTVAQAVPGRPQHIWSWSHNEVPNAFLIQIDGITVERLDPADLTLDAGRYTWTDSGQIPPLGSHTLAVRAVEDGARSTAALLTDYSHHVAHLWLIHDTHGAVPLADTRLGDFTRIDRFASYAPLSGPEVDVIYEYEGRRGNVEGTLFAGWSGDDKVSDVVTALREIATAPVRTAQLVWGSQSARVRVRDVDVTSHDDITARSLLHVVRFSFVEVGY